MKNRIILGAIVASVCSFALYLNNMKRYESATLTISRSQNNTQTVTEKNEKGKKQETSPTLEKITKKGNSKLAAQIQKAMKNSNSYDVKVLDLKNSNNSAEVYNKKDKVNVSDSLKAFLLVGLYKEMEQKKIKATDTLTPTASEIVKGDSTFTANTVYSLTYVRQNLMSKNSNTAANLLLNKLGKEQVNNIIKEMGTSETVISNKFGESVVGTTSAEDLAILMKSLYNGKFLENYSNTVLTGLSTYSVKSPLVNKISNANIIQIGDNTSAVALVTTDKHSYVIAVTSQNNNSFAELGLEISTWFNQN
ncbi:serine hydrolase [Lactobacillus mulieris]|uniref:Class A beta-lactamase-related serine hydrolase n=1 Tax=Lactobacillus mulieris TaxID=2508708 RepID=A0AAW5WXC4_9LACO|nr:serine hydrolase [Lactobacillus mulieris]MCZ3621746.1 class A beta-lactamase-related serine hydrolase [Lactobacillus mulieris]MCZ3623443.1 class A beta-lactamase-related serine hydrolase [Lactobacillus mulieris]MCZ3635753.1 class A beta-lactamase-related serine hydrolase [Lactobacillus mulieris]MCZ3690531.1 class A beta-lactamase-related serine hydrolase [Lactobacillus mulieris]MCZ3696457.1 class A beta-lactamase-related serine hydrolase [Lactobacillus mulieris]